MRQRSSPALICALLNLAIISGCKDSREAILDLTTSKTVKRNLEAKQAIHSAFSNRTNTELQVWHQFLEHWPEARQGSGFTWYEQKRKFEGKVDAAAIVENRYVLKIIIDFEMTGDYQKMLFKNLRFHFFEVKEVHPPSQAGGASSITYQPDQKWFVLEDWRRLVDSNWNFATIGITVVSNAPIPNIRSVLPNL